MTFRSSAVTHVGMVRKLNEDSMMERSDIGVWAVADGMGGHAAGEVASQMVTSGIKNLQPAEGFDEMVIAVEDCLREANRQLLAQSDSYDSHRMPGSTVVVLVIDGEQGAVVWAGDSRIYRRRNEQISQLTRDHSHVQDLVDQNMIRAEDAESHPMANVITRAIGIVEPLEIETRLVDVDSKDQFLLCSDGLSRMASDDEIDSTLATKSGEDIVQSLLQTALERGASDNVTLICVQENIGEDTNEIFLDDLKETSSEDATVVQNAPPIDENTNEIYIGNLEESTGKEKPMAPDSISLDEFD